MTYHREEPLPNPVEEQTKYAAIELLGWHQEVAGLRWLFQSGSNAAPHTWSPFTDDNDAWLLFSLWVQAKQIHKAPGGIAVAIQMPNADLITFGAGSGRYCGPLLCQAMAAAVGHYREAQAAYTLIERKRQFRSQRYEDRD